MGTRLLVLAELSDCFENVETSKMFVEFLKQFESDDVRTKTGIDGENPSQTLSFHHGKG